ncbi:MAG: hypothetical protein H7099_05105 [Gemmatimonadaceae bacterium]|nr:hypothetical protein [Gemmatimonadaceae bacterium]
MTGPATDVAPRLSTLRLVCFVPHERDAVHVGLLTPDAQRVVDLLHLGITDITEAFERLQMLRQAAGAIIHGAASTSFAMREVHLVASVPLARSVVQDSNDSTPRFADPATLHGPGGHLGRIESAAARPGLAVVVGDTIHATHDCADDVLQRALIGSVVVLGWPHHGASGAPELRPGAVGPFVAVPRRRPESVMLTRVAPVGDIDGPDAQQILTAPGDAQFFALARAALRSHTLRPGDLLTIFPAVASPSSDAPMAPGSWVRVSAPGLGTLSLAVR